MLLIFRRVDFEMSAQQGAVLVLPRGASREELYRSLQDHGYTNLSKKMLFRGINSKMAAVIKNPSFAFQTAPYMWLLVSIARLAGLRQFDGSFPLATAKCTGKT